MKNHNISQVDKHIQWLMRFMQDEYPNNYEIVIGPAYAQIRSTQREMTFIRDDTKPENIHFSDEDRKRGREMMQNMMNGFDFWRRQVERGGAGSETHDERNGPSD